MPIMHGKLADFASNKKVIVSALTDKAISSDALTCDSPFVLVLGNEASGVSKDIINQADIVTKIPISNIDSLNVAVAAGILMDKLK